jgi:hypothetical protein
MIYSIFPDFSGMAKNSSGMAKKSSGMAKKSSGMAKKSSGMQSRIFAYNSNIVYQREVSYNQAHVYSLIYIYLVKKT